MTVKEDLLMNHDTPRSLPPMQRVLPSCILVLIMAFAAARAGAGAETNIASNIGLKIITEGFGAPIALAAIPDGSGRLLLAEQSGVIHLIEQNGKRSEQLFLDLCAKMVAIAVGSTI
jgi:hypothetical protein